MPPLLDKITDPRIVHHGTWEQFKFIQKGFEGSPEVRELNLDLLRRCILMAQADAGEAIRAFRREI